MPRPVKVSPSELRGLVRNISKARGEHVEKRKGRNGTQAVKRLVDENIALRSELAQAQERIKELEKGPRC